MMPCHANRSHEYIATRTGPLTTQNRMMSTPATDTTESDDESIESDDVTYLRPDQMAALAQDRMNEAGDSGYAVAQELGVNRSTVYRALGNPSTRHLQTLTRILGLYGITADPDSPAFPVGSDDE